MYEPLMRPETREYLRTQREKAAKLRVLKPEEWCCSLDALVEIERHCELAGLPHEDWPAYARTAQFLSMRSLQSLRSLRSAFTPR
jgi:hypothetical protein